MALPDLSRLSRLSAANLRALSDRLRALDVGRSTIAPFAAHAEQLLDKLRGPVRTYYLRKQNSALCLALRMFVFMDPVTREQAQTALGSEALLGALLEAGLLVQREQGVVCPLLLNVVEDKYIFCDDLANLGEAVMGAGATTASLIQSAWPLARAGRVLDLGCGAGTAALLLAARAEHAVGIDINPRAIELSRLNQAVNAIDNAEFACGDLFAPVAGQRFDLIVSQPPFVSKPAANQGATFLHGGARGDEFTLRMLRELPGMLARHGRAVMLVDWPRYDAVSPVERIRAALDGAACDVLVLASPPKNIDEYVAFYAAGSRPELGASYAEAVHAHLAHLEQLGIDELRSLFIVLRATDEKPWSHRVEMRRMSDLTLTSAQVERLIRAQDLLAGPEPALLASKLLVPEGTRFAQAEDAQVRIDLDPSRVIGTVTCTRGAAELLSVVNDSPSVDAAVERVLQQLQLPAAERGRVVSGVRGALGQGLLEVSLD